MMPKPPPGFAACRVHDGQQALIPVGATRQISHLVVAKRGGGYSGPTLCGLTRFDDRDPDTWQLIRPADLPGWSMNGGVSGPGIEQIVCEECWSLAAGDIERPA